MIRLSKPLTLSAGISILDPTAKQRTSMFKPRTPSLPVVRRVSSALLLAGFSISALADGRVSTSFDADWRFFKGDAKGAQATAFNDGAWRPLSVPHDWSIEGPYD